jgi:hypothetical protein
MDDLRGGGSGRDLHRGQLRRRVQQQRGCQLRWQHLEASLRIVPGSQRLSSSKGQTRREAGAQSHGPPAVVHTLDPTVVARLPKGWAGEKARPSPGAGPDFWGRPPVPIQGSVNPVMRRLALLFAPALSSHLAGPARATPQHKLPRIRSGRLRMVFRWGTE